MFIDTTSANKILSRPRIVVSPRTSPYNDSSTPLLETFFGQDAPPSYLEATTPGLYTSRLSEEQGARLLSADGREAKDAKGKEEKYQRRSYRNKCLRKTWPKLVGAALAVMMLTALPVMLLTAKPADGLDQTTVHGSVSSAQPGSDVDSKASTVAQSPGTEHSSHSEGSKDDDLDVPHLIAVPWPSQVVTPAQPLPSTQSTSAFPVRWPSRCGKEYNVKTEEHDFGQTKELNIQEAVHQTDNHYKMVAGWIHVTKAPADQLPGTIRAKVSYAASSSVNINSIQHSSTATGLTIGDPSFPDGFDGMRRGSACLGMSVVVYMAPGTTLESLNVASTHMGMQIHSGVEFSVANSTIISLITGTLDSVTFSSRETHLNTISGSISGKYSLSNLISIKTISGSVNINVEPKESQEAHSEPAIFAADTLSGSLRVDFERRQIPERDYQTYINTTVGSVDGTFIHGSKTEITSVAGSVTADLLPFKSGEHQSEIFTHTNSGQTSLAIRSPYKAKDVPIAGLVSTHKSISGGLNVIYPEEWVGFIGGTSLSGALHLQGKDLVLLNENDEPRENHVEAKKGSDGSIMSFDTVSGGCDIIVGKV